MTGGRSCGRSPRVVRAVVVEDRARRARWLVTAIDEELTDEETARLRDAARLLNKIMDRSEAGGA